MSFISSNWTKAIPLITRQIQKLKDSNPMFEKSMYTRNKQTQTLSPHKYNQDETRSNSDASFIDNEHFDADDDDENISLDTDMIYEEIVQYASEYVVEINKEKMENALAKKQELENAINKDYYDISLALQKYPEDSDEESWQKLADDIIMKCDAVRMGALVLWSEGEQHGQSLSQLQRHRDVLHMQEFVQQCRKLCESYSSRLKKARLHAMSLQDELEKIQGDQSCQDEDYIKLHSTECPCRFMFYLQLMLITMCCKLWKLFPRLCCLVLILFLLYMILVESVNIPTSQVLSLVQMMPPSIRCSYWVQSVLFSYLSYQGHRQVPI